MTATVFTGTFKALVATYERKRDLKPDFPYRLYKAGILMDKVDDLEYMLYQRERRWRTTTKTLPDGSTKTEWGAHDIEPTPLLRVTFDVASRKTIGELAIETTQPQRYALNSLEKITGLVCYSDTHRFANHTHKLRARTPQSRDSVPLAPGLVVNLNNSVILSHAPDTKLKVNKERSAPGDKFVREVIRVMEVAAKLGAYDNLTVGDIDSERTFDPLDLSEDALGVAAQWAFVSGKRRSQMPDSFHFERDPYSGNYVRVNHPAEYVRAKYYERIKRNAADCLRKAIRTAHGAYDTVNA